MDQMRRLLFRQLIRGGIIIPVPLARIILGLHPSPFSPILAATLVQLLIRITFTVTDMRLLQAANTFPSLNVRSIGSPPLHYPVCPLIRP